MTTVARNAPCPCGSGKRYKECHGALTAQAAEPAADAWIGGVMRQALRAQREGRVVEAAQSYRRVLSAQPANFDATHMLGLVEYEIGNYDEAVALVRRAIELRPDIGMVRQNLRLLEALPTMEVEICREALARLLPRVDTAFAPGRLADGRTVHVVSPFGEPERNALERLSAACGPSPLRLWRETTDAMASPDAARLTADEHPRGGWLVLLGATVPVSAWLTQARSEGALLVATRDDPCSLVDRADELAAAGCERPGLLCASSALARRLGLPSAAALTSTSAPTAGAGQRGAA